MPSLSAVCLNVPGCLSLSLSPRQYTIAIEPERQGKTGQAQARVRSARFKRGRSRVLRSYHFFETQKEQWARQKRHEARKKWTGSTFIARRGPTTAARRNPPGQTATHGASRPRAVGSCGHRAWFCAPPKQQQLPRDG